MVTVKIAVAGKGGVGKTLIAGALAYFFTKKGYKVLAIDADPAPNLAITLGIPSDVAEKIVPISENKSLIEEKTSTGVPGVYKLSFTVDDIVRDYSIKSPLGVNLLVMGTIRSVGGGCTCPANALIRVLLRHLIVERDEAVVIDMEAGIEHFGRATAKHVNIMLAVADANMKALEIAKKIHKFSKDAGIEKVFLVGNKVKSEAEKELLRNFSEENKIPLLGFIPYDSSVFEADMKGITPLLHCSVSEAIGAIEKIGEKLLSFKQSFA